MFGHVYDYGSESETPDDGSQRTTGGAVDKTGSSNRSSDKRGTDSDSYGSKQSQKNRHNKQGNKSNSSTGAARGDDLKKIKGIGPSISKQLMELGYVSYEQIAGLNDDDIETLQEQLKHEQDIHKQDWVGQAEKLIKLRDSAK